MGVEPISEAICLTRSSGDVRSPRSFFAATFPFFLCLRSFSCRAKKGLAGDELNGSWTDKMPSVRQSETLERRCPLYPFWRSAALFVPRLWLSFFRLVEAPYIFSFFSFLDEGFTI